LVKRILELSEDVDYVDAWLVRFGSSTDEILRDREIIYDAKDFKISIV
jgi:hypothetical protein